MKWLKNILLLFICAGLFTCIEPIDPETIEFDDLLVVEALISDEFKIHEVKLTRTFELSENTPIAESNATVWIETGTGGRINFFEVEAGLYRSVTQFSASFNTVYTLKIITSSGDEYTSLPAEMIPTPDIEDLDIVFQPDEASTEGIFSVLLNSAPTELDLTAFRWRWSETYKVQVPHPSAIIWNGFDFDRRPNPNELKTCFATANSINAIVQSPSTEDNRMVNYPVHVFHSTTQRLALRYSIEVEQYSISDDSFRFWDLIRRNTENPGGLFDEQPGTIIGNIQSVTRPSETVLGIFEVAQIKKIRIFRNGFDYNIEGYRPVSRDIIECNDFIRVANFSEVPRIIDELGPDYIPWFISSGMVFPGGYLFTRKVCGDCREHGVLETPDFWIE